MEDNKGSLVGYVGKLYEENKEEINRDESQEITCVVVDMCLGWALEVSTKRGIRRAIFCSYATMTFAQELGIRKLIDEGIVDKVGETYLSLIDLFSIFM